MTDNVNHPSHYGGRIECIEAIRECLSREEFVGYCRGNCMKYLWRYKKKQTVNPVEDLEKARVYLTWMIERLTVE